MRKERFELPEKGVRLQGKGERECAGRSEACSREPIAAVNGVISPFPPITKNTPYEECFFVKMRKERFELPEKGVRLQGKGERECAGEH